MKTKLHKFTIKQKKNSSGLMVGANTQILLDGKTLKGCHKAVFEVSAMGVAKLSLELYGTVEIEGKTRLTKDKIKYKTVESLVKKASK